MKRNKQNIRRFPFFCWCSFFFFCLNCFTIQTNAQVVVKMKLDTADILVGQQVQLKATVTADKKQKVYFPNFDKENKMVEGIEVIHQTDVDTNYINGKQRVELVRKYSITSFDSALYTIPPFKVIVDGDTCQSASSVGLKVDWVPVDTTNVMNMQGLNGIVPPTFVWRNHLLLISCCLWCFFIIAIVVATVLTKKKPLVTKKIIKPGIPPYKQASSMLEELSSSMKENNDKEFYIRLTDLLRIYLQRRFEILTMERTTDEILSDMSDKGDTTTLEQLKTIFETADLVKFAKYKSSDFEKSRMVTTVRNILDSTKDENQEHPSPEIRVIVLNEGMQKSYRRFLWISLSSLSIGGVMYIYFAIKQIFITYFN